jgi:ferrous iron transport protein B
MSTVVAQQTVVLIGLESVGKSQLAASLSGQASYGENFRGSTIFCEEYQWQDFLLIDTPGITRNTDTQTTELALAQLNEHDSVILVVQATHLDDDLAVLLPLVQGKQGCVLVTYWDKIDQHDRAQRALQQISEQLQCSVIPVDTRAVTEQQKQQITTALQAATRFSNEPVTIRAGWRIEPRPGLLEQRWLGPLLALGLLFLPAYLTVSYANQFAGWCDPIVTAWCQPLVDWLKAVCSPLLAGLLVSDYGLVTMGPKLFVWAVPTILLYAILLALYKQSGLADRINTALHPLVRPIGLNGRDILRVVMGFGCNVPAVINTRSCSRCTRGTTVSAIAFGSACSYQLPATLAIFAAGGYANWAWAYLGYLLITTLIYTRLVAPADARSSLNQLMIESRTFIVWPGISSIWREARSTLIQFLFQALPIFMGITAVASLLQYWQILPWLSQLLAPVMAIFNLPGETALTMVVASIRKDGILMLMNPTSGELITPLTGLQTLVAVYLAGVLLPCLVTAWTIAREMSWGFAMRLVARQAFAASLFAIILAWGGVLFVSN